MSGEAIVDLIGLPVGANLEPQPHQHGDEQAADEKHRHKTIATW